MPTLWDMVEAHKLLNQLNSIMKPSEFVTESAARELAKKLPSLSKHDYNTIDQLVKQVSHRHGITKDELENMFKSQFKHHPHSWLKKKLGENDTTTVPPERNPLVQKFIEWCSRELKLKSKPDFEFSYDTGEAQGGHHTGRHTHPDNKVWVYVKKRNLVDILRTVAHELRHVQQTEQGKIKPGSSYPFSPIEQDADRWAGGIIKIFGEQHPEIYQ